MQYKEGELSKEAYIEMKDDRNSWKEFCEERKKSLEQTIRKLEKQQKEEATLHFILPGKFQNLLNCRTFHTGTRISIVVELLKGHSHQFRNIGNIIFYQFSKYSLKD